MHDVRRTEYIVDILILKHEANARRQFPGVRNSEGKRKQPLHDPHLTDRRAKSYQSSTHWVFPCTRSQSGEVASVFRFIRANMVSVGDQTLYTSLIGCHRQGHEIYQLLNPRQALKPHPVRPKKEGYHLRAKNSKPNSASQRQRGTMSSAAHIHLMTRIRKINPTGTHIAVANVLVVIVSSTRAIKACSSHSAHIT